MQFIVLVSVDVESRHSRLAIVEDGIIVAVDGKKEKAGIFLCGSQSQSRYPGHSPARVRFLGKFGAIQYIQTGLTHDNHGQVGSGEDSLVFFTLSRDCTTCHDSFTTTLPHRGPPLLRVPSRGSLGPAEAAVLGFI